MWRYRSRLTDHQVQQFLGIQPLSLDNYGWVFDEFYLPKWGLDFNYMTAPSKQPIISNASIETEIQQWHSQNRAFTVSAPTDTTINVRTFWFPGWRVEVNEQTVAVDIHPDDGTMLFQIPAGDSEVKLTFENTPVRTVGTIISGATALILIGLTMLAGYQQLSKRGESHV